MNIHCRLLWMRRLLALCVTGLCAPSAPAALPAQISSAATQQWVLYSSPVRVDAVLDASTSDARGSPLQGFSFQIVLRGPRGEQRVRTFIQGDTVNAALAALRRNVVWNAPYLFVTTACRCNRSEYRAVFKIDAGNILPLGQLLAFGPLATSYHDGRFFDYWGDDRPPAYNWGLCTACSPAVKVIMREHRGRFEVMPEATWSANRPVWDSDQKLIMQALGSDKDPFSHSPDLYQAVAETAVLAKYCGHHQELKPLRFDAPVSSSRAPVR